MAVLNGYRSEGHGKSSMMRRPRNIRLKASAIVLLSTDSFRRERRENENKEAPSRQ